MSKKFHIQFCQSFYFIKNFNKINKKEKKNTILFKVSKSYELNKFKSCLLVFIVYFMHFMFYFMLYVLKIMHTSFFSFNLIFLEFINSRNALSLKFCLGFFSTKNVSSIGNPSNCLFSKLVI